MHCVMRKLTEVESPEQLKPLKMDMDHDSIDDLFHKCTLCMEKYYGVWGLMVSFWAQDLPNTNIPGWSFFLTPIINGDKHV